MKSTVYNLIGICVLISGFSRRSWYYCDRWPDCRQSVDDNWWCCYFCLQLQWIYNVSFKVYLSIFIVLKCHHSHKFGSFIFNRYAFPSRMYGFSESVTFWI